MAEISSNEDLIIKQFTSHKQNRLFSSLQEARVAGKLTLINLQKGTEWIFYLYLGQIIYATGGEHPVRRWQRNLTFHVPEQQFNLTALEKELGDDVDRFGHSLWEYEKLFSLVSQQEISRQQASNIIWSVACEVLFDVTQAREVICTLEKDSTLYPLLDSLDPFKVVRHVGSIWEDWQKAKVADRSPNLAPVILQPQQLQEKISNSTYDNICKLLDNSKTIRDLALHLKASPLDVTTALLPYIQSGVLDLVSVEDLFAANAAEGYVGSLESQRPLIACIDDSQVVSYTIEQILSITGCRFLGINDPIRAIAEIKERKPDLILLDVVMPEINGYELCSQIKKIPEFADTPIVFLTSNSGLLDRLRAKRVGATDFVKKTVDPDRLVKVIMQHLPMIKE